MITKNKKIGIWGLGVTGKAAVNYFHSRGYDVEVMDKKELCEQDQALLARLQIRYYPQEQFEQFLLNNQYVLPSPGIDIRPYITGNNIWLNELDIFYAAWGKIIIAITGSIGKTTITHLMAKLFETLGLNIATGGNIGTPLFDLLALQKKSDAALLELSSFQLERCQHFAPDLAIITNLHPNHLDRHSCEREYLAAKAQITGHQRTTQAVLLPLTLKDKVASRAHTYYFTTAPLAGNASPSSLVPKDCTLYCIEDQIIVAYRNGQRRSLVSCETFPLITFMENWLIICAAFDICKLPLPDLSTIELTVPEHRLEKVATITGVDFYNDSKSTTAQSTRAAVDRLQGRPILLLLGGLGKGVDRTPLIQHLKNKVKKIYCFGKEAEQLHPICNAYGVPSVACATLDEVFLLCVHDMVANDQVVLSPAGSSYDLYANYIERGNHFKWLVHEYQKRFSA